MKRSPLLLALLLSLLVHLAWLGSGLLPSFASVPDATLQPIRIHLTRMELDNPTPKPKPVAQPAGAMSVAALPPVAPAARAPGTPQDASAPTTAKPANASAPQAAIAESSAPHANASAPESTPPDNGYLSAGAHHKHFPNRVKLHYQVYYGALMAGIASIDWQRDGDHYRLESLITPIIGPQLRYLSQGSIGPDGLKPDSYQAWRNQQPHEHAHFNWDQSLLEYGDEHDEQAPLPPGAQDFFSVIYQLALKGASTQPIQVTNGKKIYQYPLTPSGEADFDTGFGTIHALVFRAQGDGNVTEFWLAPDFSNQPIRIIFTRLKLDMRVTDIEIDDQNEWHLPKPIHRKTQK